MGWSKRPVFVVIVGFRKDAPAVHAAPCVGNNVTVFFENGGSESSNQPGEMAVGLPNCGIGSLDATASTARFRSPLTRENTRDGTYRERYHASY